MRCNADFILNYSCRCDGTDSNLQQYFDLCSYLTRDKFGHTKSDRSSGLLGALKSTDLVLGTRNANLESYRLSINSCICYGISVTGRVAENVSAGGSHDRTLRGSHGMRALACLQAILDVIQPTMEKAELMLLGSILNADRSKRVRF
ncbi:hypothetical protein AXFE_23080 [Acidithrix ferrooxidans]|uniref:Uncharacterized protein n=1 Tax=Acidithrix ferrooxidans TaxID=1280514 RepID=A0A0D8HG60_9ACTN|nr:hypothetical protein AXFE_23080 [Acidithrix ferrooxidans]